MRGLSRTSDTIHSLRETLTAAPGVLKVELNPRTQRVLVFFDRTTDVDALERIIVDTLSNGSPDTSDQATVGTLSEIYPWPELTERWAKSPEAQLGALLTAGSAAFSATRIFTLGGALNGILKGGLPTGRALLGGAVGFNLVAMVISTLLHTELKRKSRDTLRQLGSRLEVEMRMAVANRLMHAELSELDAHSISEIANSIHANLGQIERGFDGASELIDISANTVVLTAMFLALAPHLVWMPLLALGAMASVVHGSYRDMQVQYEAANQSRNASDRMLTELVDGLSTVKSYGLEKRFLADIRHTAASHQQISVEASRRAVNYPLKMELITLLGVSAVALGAGVSLAAGTMNPGTHLVLMMVAGHLFYPFSNLGQPLDSVTRGITAYRSLGRICQIPMEKDDTSSPDTAITLKSGIEFKNVNFAYPGGRGPALRDVNLSIPKGTVVGIVGESGSGKSTLVKLLQRFYDPADGAVLIDGVDIRQTNRASLRGLFACVDQRSYLFEGTVIHNIGLGHAEADLDAIENAASVARIHDFTASLPEGYGTHIGVRGAKLSDGQRQRILIARSLLRQSPVLVLDEGTANLDATTEREILTSMKKHMAGRTVIVVAHRLTAVKNADMIVVMSQGRVVETGTHASLVRKNGAYRALLNSQNKAEM